MKDHGVLRGFRFFCNENCTFKVFVNGSHIAKDIVLQHEMMTTKQEEVVVEDTIPLTPVNSSLSTSLVSSIFGRGSLF